ncbi:MAG: hypothetical protein ABSE76_03620 [Minisyncoccia bacterium]|jgi:hypothetical protein
MDEDEEKLRLALLEEFANSKERWTDQRLKVIERANDMQIGVSERNFQLILALVTMSVAFLTIVNPLVQNSLKVALLVPMIFAFIAALVGITQLLLTTWWDRKCIAEDGEWGSMAYGRYQNLAGEIYANLYEGSIPRDKIEQYGNLFETTTTESKARGIARSKEFIGRLILFLFYAFLTLFGLGFISLFVVLLANLI